MKQTVFSSTPECEIVTTRIFSTTPEVLFTAWSNPEHLKKWWGPKGFTNTFNEFDFRESGKWDFVMHGPEKGNYHNQVEFVKIEHPHVIAWKRISQPLFNVVFTFEKLNDAETRLVFTMIFGSSEERDKLYPYVADKNEENFHRLEEEVKNILTST